jgi:hypothetical protein
VGSAIVYPSPEGNRGCINMRRRPKPHVNYGYQVRSRQLRQRANADSSTRCWRCGLTLLEAREREPQRQIVWHAGHVIDGDNNGPLLPEHSHCNTSAGATAGNLARPQQKASRWW